jgi:hypothetical protein
LSNSVEGIVVSEPKEETKAQTMNSEQETALALVQALVQHRINEYNQWARQQDVPYAVQHSFIRENKEIKTKKFVI